MSDLAKTIDDAFEKRNDVSPPPRARCARRSRRARPARHAARRASPRRAATANGTVNQWLKKAVLLSFRLNDMGRSRARPAAPNWWDKVPSKFDGWGESRVSRRPASAPCRAAMVRRSAYIAPNVVLMPSFVNLGAYVDTGTMVDTWATVGSCAQIGKNVHISGGVGIGGVLEPLQAGPVDHRGQLLHRRALGSGRGRDRARGLGALDGRLHRRLDQDRRPRHRRDLHGRGAALFGGRVRHACPASRCRTARRRRTSIAP